MYQKSVRIHKCVKTLSTCCTKMYQKSVILLPSDTFLTHFHHQTWSILGNISKMFPWKSVRNLSNLILLSDFWYISNSAFKVTLNHKCVRNLSKLIFLTYFWYISNSASKVTLRHKCVRNLSKLIFLSDLWYISNSAFKVTLNHKCVGNLSNRILIVAFKAELEKYRKSVRKISFERFLTHLWLEMCQKSVRKISFDRFLTHLWLRVSLKSELEMYQKSDRSQCPIDLWHSSKETF